MTRQERKNQEQEQQQLLTAAFAQAGDNDTLPSPQWTVWDAFAVWGTSGLPHSHAHERPKREIRIPQSAV